MSENKVKFGLKKVHYAIATIAADGSATFATPVALPGAVNLSMSARGDRSTFYADNIAYWEGNRNNGYEGTLEVARITDAFREDILGEYADKNHVLAEEVDAADVHFALLFQFEGDQSETCHVIYNCTASRPDVASSTITDTTEPQTETLSLSANPIYVSTLNKWFTKAKTAADATTATKTGWFSTVYVPTSTT